MTHAQDLAQVSRAVLQGVTAVLEKGHFDRVLVHGDTATTMAASLAAFFKKVPVAHVEAGLRSGDPMQPWPEEINRRVTDVIADLYFAPTSQSRQNLLREHVAPSAIHVTGNTVIDALIATLDRIDRRPDLLASMADRFSFLDPQRRVLLVTGHRRESFGAPFLSLCSAIRELAMAHPIEVVYPVHPNPNVRAAVDEVLADVPNVHLIEPLDYLPFVYLMRRSHVILTDSGGIQEEAPTLGKPVFVMRNITERPEAVEAGTVKLVGTDRKTIVRSVSRVLCDEAEYKKMSRSHNPYGDGLASLRIASVLAGGRAEEFGARLRPKQSELAFR
jgi:UDP-N-acetylglucosamine 2-epimerase